MTMKLNLGCGANKKPGYLNVDQFPGCEPDMVLDLEETPWPWEDNSFNEVLLIHVLEHLGANPVVFVNIMKELYRICAPGAVIRVEVPHPRHNSYMTDPTHVRPVLPETLEMFSKTRNREWQKLGFATTPLGLMHDVDFNLLGVDYDLDHDWKLLMNGGKVTEDEVKLAMRRYNNVVNQITMMLQVVKDAA